MKSLSLIFLYILRSDIIFIHISDVKRHRPCLLVPCKTLLDLSTTLLFCWKLTRVFHWEIRWWLCRRVMFSFV